MDLCKKCAEEPIAKGIKIIRCLKCNKETLTNVEYGMICDACYKKSNICVKCGKSL